MNIGDKWREFDEGLEKALEVVDVIVQENGVKVYVIKEFILS